MKTKEDFRIEKSKHPLVIDAYMYSVQELCVVKSFNWRKFKYETKQEWLNTDSQVVQNGHYLEHVVRKYNSYNEAVKVVQLKLWEQDLDVTEIINI